LWNFRGVLHVVDFNVDVLSGALAEVNLVLHLPSDMVNIIIDHWQGNYNGQHGNNTEGNSGIGNKFVGLDTAVGLHHAEN
jgi:hypothetical protein